MGDRLKKSLEPNLLILFEAADNIADYHDGQWGLSRKVVDAAKAELEAIRASTDAADVAESGWIADMETAPKDGTVIDVWRDKTRETVYWGFPPHCCGEMGHYCDSDWHGLKEPGWICSTFGEYVGGKCDPFTHWKPMDKGPQ